MSGVFSWVRLDVLSFDLYVLFLAASGLVKYMMSESYTWRNVIPTLGPLLFGTLMIK